MKLTLDDLDSVDASKVREAFFNCIKPDADPPATRTECAQGVRPCPFLRCSFHIWPERINSFREEDLAFDSACIVLLATTLETPSCLLDVVEERGQLSTDVIAELLGVSEQRINAIEMKAMATLRRKALMKGSLREFLE